MRNLLALVLTLAIVLTNAVGLQANQQDQPKQKNKITSTSKVIKDNEKKISKTEKAAKRHDRKMPKKWRKQIRKYKAQVAQLKAENKRLRRIIASQKKNAPVQKQATAKKTVNKSPASKKVVAKSKRKPQPNKTSVASSNNSSTPKDSQVAKVTPSPTATPVLPPPSEAKVAAPTPSPTVAAASTAKSDPDQPVAAIEQNSDSTFSIVATVTISILLLLIFGFVLFGKEKISVAFEKGKAKWWEKGKMPSIHDTGENKPNVIIVQPIPDKKTTTFVDPTATVQETATGFGYNFRIFGGKNMN